MRARLVTAALHFVTGSTSVALDTAEGLDKEGSGTRGTAAKREQRALRATMLGLEWGRNPSNLQTMEALVKELSSFLAWNRYVPVPWFALVAELESVAVVVWQPGVTAGTRVPFVHESFGNYPLAYCPKAPRKQAMPAVKHVLFHSYGYAEKALYIEPEAGGAALIPNHFELLTCGDEQHTQQGEPQQLQSQRLSAQQETEQQETEQQKTEQQEAERLEQEQQETERQSEQQSEEGLGEQFNVSQLTSSQSATSRMNKYCAAHRIIQLIARL